MVLPNIPDSGKMLVWLKKDDKGDHKTYVICKIDWAMDENKTLISGVSTKKQQQKARNTFVCGKLLIERRNYTVLLFIIVAK